VPQTPHERAVARGRRRGLSTWGRWLARSNSIATVGTVLAVVLADLTLHNNLVTVALLVAGACCVLVILAVVHGDPDRRRQRKLAGYARQLEDGPRPALVELSPDVKDPTPLIDDLEKLLRENERLCVVRLHGEDTLEASPGLAEDAIPPSLQCQVIVGRISWELERASVLRENAEGVARYLRAVASRSLRKSNSIEVLRQEVAKSLQKWKVADQLVPLADARRADLNLPAGRWLVELFRDLGLTFGISYTQKPGDRQSPQSLLPERIKQRGPWEWNYVAGILSTRLSERDVRTVFQPLCDAVGDDLDLDLDLLDIRCAVIAAAAEFGEQTEPLGRLINPGSPLASAPEVQEQEAMLAVRWLIDRKATRLARAARSVTGAFDTLAVSGLVTPRTFGELMRDLGLSAKCTEDLYEWLCGNEFRRAGVVEGAEGGIRLGKTVRDAALGWLSEEQSAAYHIAAERYYRVCRVLDRAHVPPPGYTDLVAPGYGGLHLYEIPDWWQDCYIWGGHAAQISSAEHRKGAGVAITCLFLETWWWWGDQLRLEFVDMVLGLARKILQGQPEWVGALEEFDQNYVPEFDLRAGEGDRWRHVANALAFIARSLGLRRGEVPADPVLARIYVCWCFFSGDVAQHAGDLEAADGWFRGAAEACGDDEDNAGMRAFASYQRADVWILSDTDRSMRVITQTGLADAAVKLDDQSLRAYLARMYGDIRWKSGDIDAAFDAYGRALLLTYVYQVDQEWEEQPPNEYSYALYNEMRTRFLRRLGEAREKGHESEADAAIQRIKKLFGPYWELKRAATASGEDPLAGIVPPLPDRVLLDTHNSAYAEDARLMLKDKLQDQVAEPVDQPLRDPEEEPDPVRD
jgi:hypothetical protein